jgi:tetratricopeptide (TPR) repeat protein
MKETSIEQLAYLLKHAKDNNKPQPIFFLGAGASKSGGIPLAAEIEKNIVERYSDNPSVKSLKTEDRTYAKLMDCLLPAERDELLKTYIDNAKINVTHIYLAQLLKEGFVDYVLTVNFDNLMLRALALYNIFPATHDLAILKDLTTSTFKQKSVVYLHGQSHGQWLLNTPEEMDKVASIVPRIFDSIKNQRPWVFIGYSGVDPIFEHIQSLGRFDNGLYWIGHNEIKPSENVESFLSKSNTNAFLVKGFDADSFMLKLNSELGIGQPDVINRPFTALSDILNEIVDIDDEDHFKGVKERLEVAKNQATDAIEQYELGKVAAQHNNSEVDILKKEIINLLVGGKFPADTIAVIKTKATKFDDESLYELLAGLYSDWGAYLAALAKTKDGDEAEALFKQVFDKYQQAVKINPDNHNAFNNWANGLAALATTKDGDEAESLFQQAFDKYQQAVKINPDNHDTFNNWANGLAALATTKDGGEAEALFQQAFDRYQQAVKIKPDHHEVLNNWGANLAALAKTKDGDEAEALFKQAFDKYQQADEQGGHCYNLACLYAIRDERNKALRYLDLSLSKQEISTSVVVSDEDWNEYLLDDDFKKTIDKYT